LKIAGDPFQVTFAKTVDAQMLDARRGIAHDMERIGLPTIDSKRSKSPTFS